MVINDLDIPGFASHPFKTDSPLIVDPDTVLTTTLTFEFFEPMARDTFQILQIFGVIQVQQLPASGTLNILRQFCRNLSAKYLFGLFGHKGLDHDLIISPDDNIVKRNYSVYTR